MFILGKKIEMTQIFQGNKVVPVTKILAGPCLITQIKNKEKDGYQAVQLGFGKKNLKNKPLIGHLKKTESEKNFNYFLREFLIEKEEKEYQLGEKVTVDIFKPGDKLKVRGWSKGRGFQGVVKRHGFHGSPATHGHKDQLRMPGSIGATGPAKVFKGVRMGGRMGGNRVTVNNLEVIGILPKENILLVKGAVPGARNSFLEILKVN